MGITEDILQNRKLIARTSKIYNGIVQKIFKFFKKMSGRDELFFQYFLKTAQENLLEKCHPQVYTKRLVWLILLVACNH